MNDPAQLSGERFPFGRLVGFAGLRFDAVGQADVLSWLAARNAGDAFAYLVTPNADHVVRLARGEGGEEVRKAYEDAAVCLND